MCAHTGKNFRTLEELHKKETVWCNKMSGSEVLDKDHVPAEKPTIILEPVNNVASAVQIYLQQLAIQLQQMQEMMQEM